jgi:hypothetical protein
LTSGYFNEVFCFVSWKKREKTMESMTKDFLMQTLQTQQRTSDDIAEIKATLKEAAQIVKFLNRDVVEIKTRVEKLERHPGECLAAKRHEAWSMTGRDFAWLIGLIAAIGAALAIRF